MIKTKHIVLVMLSKIPGLIKAHGIKFVKRTGISSHTRHFAWLVWGLLLLAWLWNEICSVNLVKWSIAWCMMSPPCATLSSHCSLRVMLITRPCWTRLSVKFLLTSWRLLVFKWLRQAMLATLMLPKHKESSVLVNFNSSWLKQLMEHLNQHLLLYSFTDHTCTWDFSRILY